MVVIAVAFVVCPETEHKDSIFTPFNVIGSSPSIDIVSVPGSVKWKVMRHPEGDVAPTRPCVSMGSKASRLIAIVRDAPMAPGPTISFAHVRGERGTGTDARGG